MITIIIIIITIIIIICCLGTNLSSLTTHPVPGKLCDIAGLVSRKQFQQNTEMKICLRKKNVKMIFCFKKETVYLSPTLIF